MGFSYQTYVVLSNLIHSYLKAFYSFCYTVNTDAIDEVKFQPSSVSVVPLGVINSIHRHI